MNYLIILDILFLYIAFLFFLNSSDSIFVSIILDPSILTEISPISSQNDVLLQFFSYFYLSFQKINCLLFLNELDILKIFKEWKYQD